MYAAIHVVEENGQILVLGSTCFAKRFGSASALGLPAYSAGGGNGKPLTEDERQLLMNNTAELYEKYGDKICISVVNDSPIDPTTASEEEVRQAARDYVAKYCKPGKPSQYSMYSNPAWMGRPEFMEELYKASRKVYGA